MQRLGLWMQIDERYFREHFAAFMCSTTLKSLIRCRMNCVKHTTSLWWCRKTIKPQFIIIPSCNILIEAIESINGKIRSFALFRGQVNTFNSTLSNLLYDVQGSKNQSGVVATILTNVWTGKPWFMVPSVFFMTSRIN